MPLPNTMTSGRLSHFRFTTPALLALTCLLLFQGCSTPEAVRKDTGLVMLVTGFRFTEGPVADDGDGVYFSDIPNRKVHHWDPVNGLSTLIQDSEGSNGLYFDKAGSLILCQKDGRKVSQRNTKTGAMKVLAETYNGKKFNSPNDLWIDARNGIYFTDPAYGASANTMEQDGMHVYYITPDRKYIIRVADKLGKPNGVIGTPDGKTLYVADTDHQRIYQFNIEEDGMLANKRIFATQGSDGMTLDALGNLYLTSQTVDIYNPEGILINQIEVPEKPANVTFGGLDGKTLFVTARTSVYGIVMGTRGAYRITPENLK